MCIHTKYELEQTILYFNRMGHENISGVMMRSPTGRLIGAWTCHADQPESIAKSIAQVIAWHIGQVEQPVADLSLVNTWRRFHDMAPLHECGLPRIEADEIADVDDRDFDSVRAHARTWLTHVTEANYEVA